MFSLPEDYNFIPEDTSTYTAQAAQDNNHEVEERLTAMVAASLGQLHSRRTEVQQNHIETDWHRKWHGRIGPKDV
jgi:hypothetical protein